MNKKIVLLFLVIYGLFYPAYLISAEEHTIIRSISFSGLKRTREDVVLQIIDPVTVGSVYTDNIGQYITQKLRETGIFVPDIEVATEIIEQDAFIKINVQDKWTLIPIPIVSVSKGESWNAGVLTIENNLLGFYKTLGLGFFYGSEGWTLLSFYVDPYFLKSDFEFTASLAAGLDDISDLNANESIAREYQTDRLSPSLGIKYPITSTVSVGGIINYDLSLPRESDIQNISELNSLGLEAQIVYENLYYDIPYEKGFVLSLSSSINRNFSDFSFFPIVESSLQWSFTPWFNHMISFKGGAGWGRMPIQKQFRLGGLDGSRILPMGKIAADEYAFSTFIYNLPVWIFKAGSISAKAFYELGYFKSDLIDRNLFHGPGLGLEFYINKLAIPAVGINIGWNLAEKKIQFSAGIGM